MLRYEKWFNDTEYINITGVSVATITCDGTNDYKNDVIIPYRITYQAWAQILLSLTEVMLNHRN